MALKRNERYPGRFSNPTTEQPQGAFKNRTAPSAQDGSYLEQDWANDWSGFFGRLLTVADITANGDVDTALSSQYYDALDSLYGGVIPVTRGGTGGTTVATALSNLGLSDIVLAGTGSGTLASPGYALIPLLVGGVRRTLVVQWGNTLVNTQAETVVTLPLAFPTAPAVVVVSKGNVIESGGSYAVGASPTGTTKITIRNTGTTAGTSQGTFWIALGY